MSKLDKDDQEYWRQLYDSYKESAIQFDKNVLFISSGSLAISITFISEIVHLKNASEKWMLTTSWIILASTIFASLLSHYLSMKAINKRISLSRHFSDKIAMRNKILNFDIKDVFGSSELS